MGRRCSPCNIGYSSHHSAAPATPSSGASSPPRGTSDFSGETVQRLDEDDRDDMDDDDNDDEDQATRFGDADDVKRMAPRKGGYGGRIEQILYEQPDLEIHIVEAKKNSEGGGNYIAYTIRTGVGHLSICPFRPPCCTAR